MAEPGMEKGNTVMKCGKNMAMHTWLFLFSDNPTKVRKRRFLI
jgi:hypothetical protein